MTAARTLSPGAPNPPGSSPGPDAAARPGRPGFWGLLLLLGIWLLPWPVWAIQTHGDPEGLYIHQLGHLLFLGAMVYIVWELQRRRLTRHPGFRHLARAALLLGFWNLLAFIGHLAEERLPREIFLPGSGYFSRKLLIQDLTALVYYAAKLDHLILVPALVFFYLGLRQLLRQPPREEGA